MATLPNFATLTALIIDDMSVQQTTLRGQLSSLGIGKVDASTTAEDAIRMIRSRPYNLILCDYNLNARTDGQQLLEHLRDQNLLAADALFFMVTAEGAYASVAAANEHKPDAYLLKPITATDIGERLRSQLERRQALLPILAKLQKKDWAGAVACCDELIARRDRWLMQALQYKGQTLLQMGRHEDAKTCFYAALDERPDLVWARLGLARAHKAAGKFADARQIATELIESPEGDKLVAAYDVIAESMEAEGDAHGAMWVLRDAATVVPSARRHRLLGESAYRNGDLETAKDSFQKVTKLTKSSITAQTQDMLWLGQTLVDRGEYNEAVNLMNDGVKLNRQDPAFEAVSLAIKAQAQLRGGQEQAAKATLERARSGLRKAKADFGTVALAKAELLDGNEAAGLALMEQAISADHENTRLQQLIGNALRDTGHEDKVQSLIEAAAAGLETRVKEAKSLFRDSKIDEALSAIESAVADYPENTGVLLQAAQMNCLSLRLKKQLNSAVVERVRLYLARLETLMPANDRVTQMQRYYRDTVATLNAENKAAGLAA
ncbi:tetratricopeptide repeat protein [Ideonella margarita]|uniref:Tetratricopeptide repeat protein n=1 Tax=Ideonella margarita TaxID=2984191 RepID=A0ABU9C5Y0_9BURK